MPGKRFLLVFVVTATVAVTLATPASGDAVLPPRAAGWPTTLQLGLSDGPDGAARLARTTDFGFRYQYLAGGVNTGGGWANWNSDGHFVTYYIEDSIEHGITPVFSYYMLQHSRPGGSGEADTIRVNLQDRDTMAAFYADLKLFFRRAGAFPAHRVLLHVEPDLWGFAQQMSAADDAASVPAAVSSTGLSELDGLPNDLSGFARAIVRLRDELAPNVDLGYHLSVWGTLVDISLSDPSEAEVDRLAASAARFYRSLEADFDLVFGEFGDRDAAFKESVYGDGGASWWTPGDFRRHVRFLARFVADARERIVLWQIPLGNTKMRAMNNTWHHFQDNRVQWLLGRRGREHLQSYAAAGVVALLFGGGADGTTCACDAARDGVTNPQPINGNTKISFNADDDGGYFRRRARRYYKVGGVALP